MNLRRNRRSFTAGHVERAAFCQICVRPRITLALAVLLAVTFASTGTVAGQEKCKVKSFSAPHDESDKVGADSVTRHFEVDVEFDATAPNACKCCRYKQSIEGEFRKDGNKVTIKLVTEDPTASDPSHTKEIDMEKDTYHEDWRNYGGKNVYRYGVRTQDPYAGTPGVDKYTPDRLAGCNYHTMDDPGWSGCQTGHTYSFDLHFKGEIVSSCEGGCDGCTAKEWTAKLEKKF